MGYQCRRDWFYLSLIKWNDVYESISTHFIVAPVGLTFTLTSIISRAKAAKKNKKREPSLIGIILHPVVVVVDIDVCAINVCGYRVLLSDNHDLQDK